MIYFFWGKNKSEIERKGSPLNPVHGKGNHHHGWRKKEITLTDLEIRGPPCKAPNFNTIFFFWEERIELKSKKLKGKDPWLTGSWESEPSSWLKKKGVLTFTECEISSHPYIVTNLTSTGCLIPWTSKLNILHNLFLCAIPAWIVSLQAQIPRNQIDVYEYWCAKCWGVKEGF